MNNIYSPNPNPYRQPNSIIWVQGIEGAKAYQLLPCSNIVLMDSEDDRFFIKSTDNVGMSSLRSFRYVEEKEKPKEEYITRTELEEIIASLKGESHESDLQGNE